MELVYNSDDLDILRSFLEETDEHLDGMEENILLMEDCSDDQLVNTIFRAMHTLKGTSGYLNLNHIKHLSHESESLVGDIRSKLVDVNSEIISVLLNTTDILQKMFSSLKKACASPSKTDNGEFILDIPDLPYEPLIEKIKDLRKKTTEKDKASDKKTVVIQDEIRELKREEALSFVQTTTKAIEALKNSLNDLTIPEKQEAAQTRFETYTKQVLNAGKDIEYNSLVKKIIEIQNLYDFIKTGEPEMRDTILNSLRDGIRTLFQLIDHPKLKSEPKRDPQLRTRASDSEETVVSTIRVPGERLDKFMNLIGELVVSRNVFEGLSEELRIDHGLNIMSKKVKDAGSTITRISEDLQTSIMEIRMMPVKTVFSRYSRMVHDLAKVTEKTIKLTTEGEDTELDKTVIEKIGDPLVHMIRNSADHGLEPPDERLKNNKPETGSIHLRAVRKGQEVLIEVKDDGRGLSREKIGKKAIEKGLITQNKYNEMDDSSVFQLLMAPGFSTAEQVTELSGRGVGMDVVRSNIEKIGGNISINSQLGIGTTVTMSIPLTLTVTRGLLIESSDEKFILPLENVIETIKIKPEQIHNFKGQYSISHRNSVLNVACLDKILKLSGSSSLKNELISLVILRLGNQTVAIQVDKFYKEIDILIKPLEGKLGQIKGISGASIQGDGSVVLILNPMELLFG